MRGDLLRGLILEIERVRALVREHETRGRLGLFTSLAMRRRIDEAEAALVDGDVERIVRAYAGLTDCS